jgi:transposase-like protein
MRGTGGKTAEEIARMLEISKQTYYRWRKEYGGAEYDADEKAQETRKRECQVENPGSRFIFR